MNSFNLKIVTFDKILFEGDVLYCAIRTLEGKFGFKARHEAFVTVLKENSSIECKLRDQHTKKIDISNGLFVFRNNSCTITVWHE